MKSLIYALLCFGAPSLLAGDGTVIGIHRPEARVVEVRHDLFRAMAREALLDGRVTLEERTLEVWETDLIDGKIIVVDDGAFVEFVEPEH